VPTEARTRDLVVIGGSAGSLEALKTLISKLPTDLRAAILVVIHIIAAVSLSCGACVYGGYVAYGEDGFDGGCHLGGDEGLRGKGGTAAEDRGPQRGKAGGRI
jgi:CheB methylesterase